MNSSRKNQYKKIGFTIGKFAIILTGDAHEPNQTVEKRKGLYPGEDADADGN